MERSLGQKIIRNNITNIIKFLTLLPVGFILTPIFIKYLGTSVYGIWILIGTFIAYVNISELNIGQGSVKFISEYYGKRDFRSINAVVNTAFTAYAAIGLATSLFMLLIMNWLLATFFHLSGETAERY